LLVGAGLCFFSLSASARPAKNSSKAVSYATAKNVRSHATTRAQPKLNGVWGWTTGSQTYLRVRPGAQTPPVAKVPRRSKLFVWGKYNGWYRVETTDNKFGWVYHSYINAPQSEKLAELSHKKARLASNRTSGQVLYGSPQLLRSYYARYGASGALKGLAKQGVRVARSTRSRSPKLRTASYNKPTSPARFVRTSTRSTTRQRLVRMSDPTFNDVGNVRLSSSRPAPRSAAFQIRKAGIATSNGDVSVSTSAVASNDDAASDTSMVTSSMATSRGSIARTSTEAIQKAEATRRARIARRAQEERQAAEKRQAENARRVAEERRIAEAQRTAQAQRIAQAERAVGLQRAAEIRQAAETQRLIEAQRLEQLQRLEQAKRLADAQRAEQVRRDAETRRIANARAAREARRKTASLRASRKLAARQARRQRLAQQKAQQRARLRASMGAATLEPPTALPGIHPLTPDELLRARESYLSSRHKTRPLAPLQSAPQQGTPQQMQVAPSLPSSTTGVFTPSSYMNVPKWTPYVMASAYRRPLSPLTQPLNMPQDASETPGSKNALPANTLAGRILFAKSPSAATRVTKSRSATRRTAAKVPTRRVTAKATDTRTASVAPARLAPRTGSRGGSPRDYVRYAMNNGAANNSFGQVMANQALSYRGAPYIRGANSPGRGFDCSGLVYYLLRQRGYNPPRTAAGLASYGQSVSRKNMKAGDIVLFANTYKRGVSHVGVYMGEGKFVHAARSGVGVRVDSLSSRYYGGKFWGARRVK
jgi:cell wall-associated NlpC family hydrolase